MPLSDLAVRNAKPGEKPRKLSDERGLYLYLTPKGTKFWRYDFRFEGKRQTLSFGKWPRVGLGDARRMRDEAAEAIAAGIDPRAEDPTEDNRPTFKDVGEQWFRGQADHWSAKHFTKVRSALDKDLYPHMGSMPIADIEPPALIAAIRQIEDRGARDLSRQIRGYASKVFQFAIAEGLATRDPANDIRAAMAAKPKVTHHAKITAAGLPAFLGKLHDGETLEEATRDALTLTLLTAARTGETRFASVEEFRDLDGNQPVWELSAERMKMEREHLVPLSRQAVEIVKRRIEAVGGEGYLFGARTRSGVMSENTMLYALYRMGYHSRATVHGLRGTFSTIANEHEWNGDWIEMALAHVEGGVRGAYNAAQWLSQRRKLLQWWADYLDERRSLTAVP